MAAKMAAATVADRHFRHFRSHPNGCVDLHNAFIQGQGNKFMPLINCPECGRQVSTEAQTCPACGYPVASKLAATQPAAGAARDELLREVRPSWWHFFWHLFFFWLIVPPIIALCR